MGARTHARDDRAIAGEALRIVVVSTNIPVSFG
jgi:hypothetical protein